MIIRTLESLRNTDRDIRARTNAEWSSQRFLLKKDGFPFSVNYTQLEAGCRMEIAYRNHHEACLCVAGRGRIHASGSAPHELVPGVLYALEKGERHVLEALEPLTLISIFSPALVGPEIHDETGNYRDLSRDA